MNNLFISGIVWIIICELVGIVGSVFTVRSIRTWYNQLRQPSFRPPNYVFGPVWTVLYALMGDAAALLMHAQGFHSTAMVLFVIQLVLNAIWTPLFFGAKQLGWAFVEIAFMWLCIALTIVNAWPVNHTAAILLIPYLAWVSFASVLNFTIWKLNKK